MWYFDNTNISKQKKNDISNFDIYWAKQINNTHFLIKVKYSLKLSLFINK